MSYRHLSEQERYAIAIYHTQGISAERIGKELQRDPTTIRRELRRNGDRSKYDAAVAHKRAQERQSDRSSRSLKVTARMRREIVKQLGWGYSPDLISGRSKREGIVMVSTEWIYQLIYRDAARGGDQWKSLHQQRKRRKRRSKRHDGRGQIPNRVMISERPKYVEERRQIGHWEGDSILGKGNRSAILSLIERTSRYLRLLSVTDRSADATATAIIRGLRCEELESLTVDNGKEFTDHQRISRKLDSDVYFAEAYSPWQRGSNENVNRLVRRYFRKGTDLSKVRDSDLSRVEHIVNNRPRKILDYATPWEVYSGRAQIPSDRAL